MKKTLMTAVMGCALAAPAMADHSHFADPNTDWRHNLTVGHFFDWEEEYVSYNFSTPSGIGAQLLYMDDGVSGASSDVLALGLSLRQYEDTDNFGRLYWGGSLGLARINTVLDDTNTFYADLVLGVNVELSDNVDLNVGLRAAYFDDFDLAGVPVDIDNVDFGVEVGISWKF